MRPGAVFLLRTRRRSRWRRRPIDRFSRRRRFENFTPDAQSRNLWDCRRLMDPLCAAQTRRMADFTSRDQSKTPNYEPHRGAFPFSFFITSEAETDIYISSFLSLSDFSISSGLLQIQRDRARDLKLHAHYCIN